MRSLLSSVDDEKDDPRGVCCWWRSAHEFDDEGRLKIENFSNLTPRLKVLREMERLALLAPDSLDDFRHKLLSYRSGDFWLPTGGIKKEQMEIPPVITILLVGFSGSGKSSLINLMYSVLGRSGLIPFAQTSGDSSYYSTMYLEEHNVLRSVRSGFCVYDSRGLDYDHMYESFEVLGQWMADGVHHYQHCFRPSEDNLKKESVVFSYSKFAIRRVNCAMVVADMAEIYRSLNAGNSKPLEATRELFHSTAIRKCNENPILIFTHGDMLSTEERLDGRIKICKFLGISEMTGAYDIPCVTEQGFLADESDPVTAYTLTEAVYRALIFSDRSHLPKKNIKGYVLLCVSWIMCTIAAFFAVLAYFFSKLGKKNHMLKR